MHVTGKLVVFISTRSPNCILGFDDVSALTNKRRKRLIMFNKRSIFAALYLCLALTVTAAAQEKSLYERLGGEAAVSAVIEDFVARVAADERINKKFARSNIDRVKAKLKEQVCAVTGGPCKYTGLDMKTAHTNMKVTEGEFNALVEDLVATLDKSNVQEKEKSELLAILGPLKDQIVEVKGDATGTPLPNTFKPAPPLKKDKM